MLLLPYDPINLFHNILCNLSPLNPYDVKSSQLREGNNTLYHSLTVWCMKNTRILLTLLTRQREAETHTTRTMYDVAMDTTSDVWWGGYNDRGFGLVCTTEKATAEEGQAEIYTISSVCMISSFYAIATIPPCILTKTKENNKTALHSDDILRHQHCLLVYSNCTQNKLWQLFRLVLYLYITLIILARHSNKASCLNT